MSATAIVVMVMILAFVWGGFLLILATAMRKERRKGEPASPGGT
ncbi:MAG: hypothetical protein ACE5HP_01220 [Gemmatimonadota bacterium]